MTVVVEDRALAQLERVRDASRQQLGGAGQASGALHVGGDVGSPVLISANIEGMNLGRISWISVIAVCTLAVVLFAVNGYTGYAITVGAVGAAAAVNLT